MRKRTYFLFKEEILFDIYERCFTYKSAFTKEYKYWKATSYDKKPYIRPAKK